MTAVVAKMVMRVPNAVIFILAQHMAWFTPLVSRENLMAPLVAVAVPESKEARMWAGADWRPWVSKAVASKLD